MAWWNTLLGILTGVGGAAGAASEGSASGRQAEASLTNQYNQLLAQMARDAYEAELSSAKHELTAPQTLAKSALMGDYMAKVQPVSLSHPRATIPKMTGGWSPASMSPGTRAAGGAMNAEAVRRLSEGGTYGAPTYERPTLATMPQAGFLSKLGSAMGIGAAGFQAAAPYLMRGGAGAAAAGTVPGASATWPAWATLKPGAAAATGGTTGIWPGSATAAKSSPWSRLFLGGGGKSAAAPGASTDPNWPYLNAGPSKPWLEPGAFNPELSQSSELLPGERGSMLAPAPGGAPSTAISPEIIMAMMERFRPRRRGTLSQFGNVTF